MEAIGENPMATAPENDLVGCSHLHLIGFHDGKYLRWTLVIFSHRLTTVTLTSTCVGLIKPPVARRRVLIVDDHDFFSACLRSLLNNEADLVVCDRASDSTDLLDRIARSQP